MQKIAPRYIKQTTDNWIYVQTWKSDMRVNINDFIQ